MLEMGRVLRCLPVRSHLARVYTLLSLQDIMPTRKAPPDHQPLSKGVCQGSFLQQGVVQEAAEVGGLQPVLPTGRSTGGAREQQRACSRVIKSCRGERTVWRRTNAVHREPLK